MDCFIEKQYVVKLGILEQSQVFANKYPQVTAWL